MTIPPLTQSAYETAACPRSYVAIHIDGKGGGDSIPSERGSDIHHVMSLYIDHCVSKQVSADWDAMNTLSASSGPVAGPILDGLRDRYTVDWQHVYATETTLGLDEDFNPAYIVPVGNPRYAENLTKIPGVIYSEKPVAYIGTLDVTMLNDSITHGIIEDFKSSPSIFEADGSFQAMLYSFFLLKHIASLQAVKFVLNFVRYQNSTRSVVYNREDMPQMQAEISRSRMRQIATHANPDAALALPCKSCTYCPLAKDLTCPIADWNEYLVYTPEQRVIALEFYRRMSTMHRPLIKDHVEVRGPVGYKDANGKAYEFGVWEVAQTRYPAEATSIQLLTQWARTTGENLLDGRLNFSSTKLKGLLKAKKRAGLREQFEESVIETTTKPKYGVRTPDGITEEFNPYDEE